MPTSAKSTLVAVLAFLVLAAPARAAEITEQPQSVKRGETVQIAWTGDEAPASVVIERRYGLFWEVVASAEAGDVLLEQGSDGAWSARWEPAFSSPLGLHRIRVDELASDDFEVRPCTCIVSNPVRANWRDGRFQLSLTARYAAGGRVKTGRPLVRVMRDGRRVGSLRLRYEDGRFRGSWRGSRGARYSMVFELVSLADGFKNR